MNPVQLNQNTSAVTRTPQVSEAQSNAKAYAIYVGASLVGVGALIGTYFLVHGSIKKARVKKQQEVIEERGLDAGAPEAWAKRLKMAIDNDNYFSWGTDEEAIYQVFRELPNKRAYTLVQRAYKTLYKVDLNAALQDDLDSKEYSIVMGIYNKKPK